MDYKLLKAPDLSNHEIKKLSIQFREQYRPGKTSPLDTLRILEFDLKVMIIPVADLHHRVSTSALINSSWDTLYIDKTQYEDERNDKRTNFSVAHEIGHLILHKELYSQLEISDTETFYKFFSECPNEAYTRIEAQASLFASYLLVPSDEFIKEYGEIMEKVKRKEVAIETVMSALEKKFEVTREVLFKRMLREKLTITDELLEAYA